MSIDEAARTFRVLSEEEQRAQKGGAWYYILQEDRLEFSGNGNDIKICMPDGNVPISGCSEASVIEDYQVSHSIHQSHINMTFVVNIYIYLLTVGFIKVVEY